MAVIETETRGHIFIITLNRPESRNAIDGAMAAGMEAALDTFENNDDLRAGVIAANGPVFCAGADLKAISSGAGRALSTERGGFGGIVRRERRKPLIAAPAGPALAGGCEIVLACDLIVAGEAARFGVPEVKRSLVPAAGGLFRLPRAVGMAAGMELLLTGDPIEAVRAYELGLVNRVVPTTDVREAALALAGRIAANAPLAVQAARGIAARSVTDDDATLWRDSTQAIRDLAKTEDFREGPRAFVEKREPVWKGR